MARLLVSAVAVLSFALIQADDGCGYEEPPRRGLGEPCTRTTECEFDLVCSGGVCMAAETDAGMDAGSDAGMDAGSDAGDDASVDAGSDPSVDASADGGADASASTDASLDSGAPTDAGDADASPDGGGA